MGQPVAWPNTIPDPQRNTNLLGPSHNHYNSHSEF